MRANSAPANRDHLSAPPRNVVWPVMYVRRLSLECHVATIGLFYDQFARQIHVKSDEWVADHVDETARPIYGYDAGWKDPRVVLEIGATDYGQFVILDEFYRSQSHVEDAIAWLEQREKPTGRIYCEHEPADIKKITKAGYPATEAEKSIEPGIAEVRRRLEHDDNGRVGLLVSDKCEQTIREFLGYKEDHVGTAQAEDHCLDSLRYAIFTNEHQGGGVATARARFGDDSDDDSAITYI